VRPRLDLRQLPRRVSRRLLLYTLPLIGRQVAQFGGIVPARSDELLHQRQLEVGGLILHGASVWIFGGHEGASLVSIMDPPDWTCGRLEGNMAGTANEVERID